MAETINLTTEIRKAITENKVIIGAAAAKKSLMKKQLKKIILSKNHPEGLKEDLEKSCAMTNTELQVLDINSDELGILCKKQYSVSVLGVLR